MARRAPQSCRCNELGYDCRACAAAISDAEDRAADPEPADLAGGFEPDYHYPRNYGGLA